MYWTQKKKKVRSVGRAEPFALLRWSLYCCWEKMSGNVGVDAPSGWFAFVFAFDISVNLFVVLIINSLRHCMECRFNESSVLLTLSVRLSLTSGSKLRGSSDEIWLISFILICINLFVVPRSSCKVFLHLMKGGTVWKQDDVYCLVLLGQRKRWGWCRITVLFRMQVA